MFKTRQCLLIICKNIETTLLAISASEISFVSLQCMQQTEMLFLNTYIFPYWWLTEDKTKLQFRELQITSFLLSSLNTVIIYIDADFIFSSNYGLS